MPLYEYQCRRKHVSLYYSSVEQRGFARRCKTCGLAAKKAIISPPRVFGDLEGYESPASGKWVEGRRAREEDLKRTGCRPYEAGEREALVHRQAEVARREEAFVDEAVERTMNEMTL